MPDTLIMSLIRTAEVWSCGDGAARVEKAPNDFEIPELLCEKVVARVESDLSPFVLHAQDFDFVECELDALFGIPVITQGRATGCLILGIRSKDSDVAAFEIWKRDARDELALDDAVFIGLQRFAQISQFVRFPSGAGLPGQSWQDAQAKLMSGLGASSDFMRAAGARECGLEIGIGLPMFADSEQLNTVALLLSSTVSPIARAFEIWDVDGEHATLRAWAAADNSLLNAEPQALTCARGESVVGRVWETGQAVVDWYATEDESSRWPQLASDGKSNAIAYPVYVGDRLDSVFVMWR